MAGREAHGLTEFVKIEKGLGPDGRIAVVRFDRGDAINALSPEALRQLTRAARTFKDDGETSVVVLTGGAHAFSAGFDLRDPEGLSRRTMDLGSLRRRRRGAGGRAGFSHHGQRRPSARARDWPRHEHELAKHSTH